MELFGTSKELYIVGENVGWYEPDWKPKPGPGRPAGAKDSEPRTRRTAEELKAEGVK